MGKYPAKQGWPKVGLLPEFFHKSKVPPQATKKVGGRSQASLRQKEQNQGSTCHICTIKVTLFRSPHVFHPHVPIKLVSSPMSWCKSNAMKWPCPLYNSLPQVSPLGSLPEPPPSESYNLDPHPSKHGQGTPWRYLCCYNSWFTFFKLALLTPSLRLQPQLDLCLVISAVNPAFIAFEGKQWLGRWSYCS